MFAKLKAIFTKLSNNLKESFQIMQDDLNKSQLEQLETTNNNLVNNPENIVPAIEQIKANQQNKEETTESLEFSFDNSQDNEKGSVKVKQNQLKVSYEDSQTDYSLETSEDSTKVTYEDKQNNLKISYEIEHEDSQSDSESLDASSSDSEEEEKEPIYNEETSDQESIIQPVTNDPQSSPSSTTCEVEGVIVARKFINKTEELTAATTLNYSQSQDTSQLSTYTFYVHNKGSKTAIVQIQISPNNAKWVNNGLQITINPQEIREFVANDFGHYCRLAYKTNSGTSKLKIWFQAQV